MALVVGIGFMLMFLRRRGGHCPVEAGQDGSTLWQVLPFCVPPLITGGPMFVALTTAMCVLNDPDVPSKFALFAFAGGAGLGIGLVIVFGIVMRQGREIARLRGLIEARS